MIFDPPMTFYVHLNFKLGHLIHVIDESGSIWFMKKVTIADSAYSKQVPLLSLAVMLYIT